MTDRPNSHSWLPFARFLRVEAAGGVLLLLSAVAAMVWANSPWRESYDAVLHLDGVVRLGSWELAKSLLHWINDGLMAVFFFLVGLEIKRELLTGDLASPRRAALPIAAAIGGMVVPAAIFALLNLGSPGAVGWAIPMATDIAFSLGILALLGDRVPGPLKVFLAALAIVDDLGGVLVIALFYTDAIAWWSLAWGAAFLGLSLACNLLGVRRPLVYAMIGVALWVVFLRSGIHATVAGVLLAFTIPSKRRIDTVSFMRESRAIIDEFERADDPLPLTNGTQHGLVHQLETQCEAVQAPLQRIEHGLHLWVAFLIMPIFALANAGIHVGEGFLATLGDRVSLGVIAGLVVGKPLGILAAVWLVLKLRIAEMPPTVGAWHLAGAGCLAGVGFTMALFISSLAFSDATALSAAKAATLVASAAAGLLGVGVLMLAARRARASAAMA